MVGPSWFSAWGQEPGSRPQAENQLGPTVEFLPRPEFTMRGARCMTPFQIESPIVGGMAVSCHGSHPSCERDTLKRHRLNGRRIAVRSLYSFNSTAVCPMILHKLSSECSSCSRGETAISVLWVFKLHYFQTVKLILFLKFVYLPFCLAYWSVSDNKRTDGPFSTERTVRSLIITNAWDVRFFISPERVRKEGAGAEKAEIESTQR